MSVYFIVDGVEMPNGLMDELFFECNMRSLKSELGRRFISETILPIVRDHLDIPNLMNGSTHVHIGTKGIEKHDHLPHLFTSVYYPMGSVGSLVLYTDNGPVPLEPVEGRLVIFSGDMLHSVDASDVPFRMAIATNYRLDRPI